MLLRRVLVPIPITKQVNILLRYCSTTCTPTQNETNLPKWIKHFNDTLTNNSSIALPTYIAIRLSTMYSLAFILSFFSVPMGPELAIGYMTSKMTGKMRQPANVAIAAGLSKAFPNLQHIKASFIFGDAVQDPSSNAEKIINFVRGPVDKYGFAFYISSKISVFSTIAGVATLVSYGVDIDPALDYLGISESVKNTGSALAAAGLINVLLVPAHLALLPYVAPRVSKSYEKVKLYIKDSTKVR